MKLIALDMALLPNLLMKLPVVVMDLLLNHLMKLPVLVMDLHPNPHMKLPAQAIFLLNPATKLLKPPMFLHHPNPPTMLLQSVLPILQWVFRMPILTSTITIIITHSKVPPPPPTMLLILPLVPWTL